MLDDVFGPPMEIECDQCKKPLLNLQLTQSMVSFKATCHRCGTIVEAENWNQPADHFRRVEDENLKRWQNKNT